MFPSTTYIVICVCRFKYWTRLECVCRIGRVFNTEVAFEDIEKCWISIEFEYPYCKQSLDLWVLFIRCFNVLFLCAIFWSINPFAANNNIMCSWRFELAIYIHHYLYSTDETCLQDFQEILMRTLQNIWRILKYVSSLLIVVNGWWHLIDMVAITTLL